jgi:BolA protein
VNRIGRHRAIHAALGPELISSIHALALDVDS